MWIYNNIRVFTQDLVDSGQQTIARLGPLAGGTTNHFFGWDDIITKMQAYVVGLVDKDALFEMRKTGEYYTISGPYGIWGDYAIKTISAKLTNFTCQTLRSDLPEDSPVFVVDMEIYKNE